MRDKLLDALKKEKEAKKNLRLSSKSRLPPIPEAKSFRMQQQVDRGDLVDDERPKTHDDTDEWRDFITLVKKDKICATSRTDSTWGTSEEPAVPEGVDSSRVPKSIRIWHKTHKQWLTERLDDTERKRLPGYLAMSKDSKHELAKLLAVGGRYGTRQRSTNAEAYAQSARDRESSLLKISEEFRWPIPRSDLSKYVNSILSTNGILMNNGKVEMKYGKCNF